MSIDEAIKCRDDEVKQLNEQRNIVNSDIKKIEQYLKNIVPSSYTMIIPDLVHDMAIIWDKNPFSKKKEFRLMGYFSDITKSKRPLMEMPWEKRKILHQFLEKFVKEIPIK